MSTDDERAARFTAWLVEHHCIVGLFFALTWWFAWFFKRQALRKQIERGLEELEKLRRDLLASDKILS